MSSLGMRLAAVFCLCFCFRSAAQNGAPESTTPRGHFEHTTVLYDSVTNNKGEKLRTFVTRPSATGAANTAGKVPVIFFVGWLSCDSMEYPDPNTRDGFGIFLRRLIDQSAYGTVRWDNADAPARMG